MNFFYPSRLPEPQSKDLPPTKRQVRTASQSFESKGVLLARAEWADAPPTEKVDR
jgi:hypothetical protein